MDLVSTLLLQAEKMPEKIVYTFLDSTVPITLTYKELALKAQAVAEKILQQGVKKGDRVLIILPQSLDYLSAFFGCLLAQVIAVPTYPPLRPANVQRTFAIANDAQATLMIVDEHSLDMLNSFANSTMHSWKNTNFMTLANLPVPHQLKDFSKPHADDIAFLQYTSGSTGQPKGVIIKHANLMYNFEMMKQGMSMSAESRIVSWLPLIHDMGLIGAGLLPVYLGAALYLMSPLRFIRKPYAWLESISNYQATHSYAPNFAYETCIEEISEAEKSLLDLSSWQVALNAAEPVRADTIMRFSSAFKSCGFDSSAFYPAYGLAEATLYVSGKSVKSGATLEKVDAMQLQKSKAVLVTDVAISKQVQTLVGCGHAWLEEKILIVDPNTHQELQVRQVGEIWLHGPHICSGYWNKPEETAETFTAKLLNAQVATCLRTGDLGYLNEKGELFIVGRIKDLIIIRGKNFSPQDIEYTVECSSELIKANSVIAFSVDREVEEQLIVVIQIRESLTIDGINVLTKIIRKNLLAEHNLAASEVVFVGRGGIPKTTSGKLQRQLCKRLYLENALPLIQPICASESKAVET